MSSDDTRQAILDAEHLRLLSIFYWVSGGSTAFFGLFSLIYIVMGLFVVFTPFPQSSASGQPGPDAFGWIFVVFGVMFLLFMETFGILKILAGCWIRKRKHRVLCLIVAGLSCVAIPYGTLLGVFSFMVLLRPSVSALFNRPRSELEAQR